MVTGSVAAFILVGTGTGQGLVWMHEGDGSSWTADTATLGGNGNHVFTEIGAYANQRVLFSAYDTMPPEPVWEDEILEFNFARVVDSAAEADLQVAMHQEYVVAGQTMRQAILRKFHSSSPAPDWTYTFPTVIYGHSYSDVRVSNDGSIIVAAVLDGATGRPRIWTFYPNSSTPIADFQVNSIYGWVTFDLSDDGSTIVFSNAQRIVVLDTQSGQQLDEEWISGMPNYGAVGISGNGQHLAYGTKGKLQTYARAGDGNFILQGTRTLGADDFCSSLEISEDGEHIGVGINRFGSLAYARVEKLQRATLNVELSYVVPAGGDWQNVVSDIALSKDGNQMAVGLWGDLAGLSPELLVFSGNNSTPVLAYHLPGSVNQLDLSPDGERLVVASKGVHATVVGGGGAFSLFETRDHDFSLLGAPSIGSNVTFKQQLQPEAYAVVLSSPQLSNTPLVVAGVGTLLLEKSTLTVMPTLGAADGNGVVSVPFQIPNSSALIGTSAYYQGLGLVPRKLSEDVVQMTILP